MHEGISRRRGVLAPIALSLLLATSLAACSNASPTDESSPSASSDALIGLDQTLADKVPAEYQDRGLTIAVTDDNPYTVFNSDGTDSGIVPDLAAQLESLLGITITTERSTSDQWIVGVQSGKYDMAAAVGDFVERQELVDFSDMAQSHAVIVTSAEDGIDPQSDLDFCGTTIGVIKGTANQKAMETVSGMCTDAGKDAVTVSAFAGTSEVLVAVQSGRVDGTLLSLAPAQLATSEQPDTFAMVTVDELLELDGANGIYGFVTAKDSGMAEVLSEAFQKLADAGIYDDIFAKWQIPGSALDKDALLVNGSTLSAG